MSTVKKKPTHGITQEISPSVYPVSTQVSISPAFIYDALVSAGFDKSISFWAAHDTQGAASKFAEYQLKYGAQMLSHSDFVNEIETEYRCYILWLNKTQRNLRESPSPMTYGEYQSFKNKLISQQSKEQP